jgi:hypothetical protein
VTLRGDTGREAGRGGTEPGRGGAGAEGRALRRGARSSEPGRGLADRAVIRADRKLLGGRVVNAATPTVWGTQRHVHYLLGLAWRNCVRRR